MVTRRKVITTVNDLARKPERDTKVCTHMKVCEADPKRLARLAMRSKSNRLIDAKISFYGTYVILNEQVTLQNQDPRIYFC